MINLIFFGNNNKFGIKKLKINNFNNLIKLII